MAWRETEELLGTLARKVGLPLVVALAVGVRAPSGSADGLSDEIARHLAALGSQDEAVRSAAAEALVGIGPRVLPRVCPFIQQHLGDKEERAWRAAYWVEEQIALRCQDDPHLDYYYKTLKPVKLPTMAAKLPGGLKMELVKIPAGTFIQGSNNPGTGVLLATDMPCNYAPVRKVTLSKPFWMARDEVSQEQWEALMGLNRCREKWPRLPADTLSWDEAIESCRRLSKLNPPHEFALPTEAQWEHACRAGTTSRHAFGNEKLLRGDSRLDEGGPWFENRFGLRHMHDGVFEWCLDWFSVYSEEACTDPVGPATGVYRSIRSNYRCCSASECRCYHRAGFPPELPRNGIGLRPVCPAK